MKTNQEKYPEKQLVIFEKVVREKTEDGYYHIPKRCDSPDNLYDTIIELTDVERETQQTFGVISLNNQMKVISCSIIHKGAASRTIVSPRDVFKEALTAGATSIAVFHNNPSGEPYRSDADVRITEILYEAGKVMDIDLVDHIIIGDGKYYSMKENFDFGL